MPRPLRPLGATVALVLLAASSASAQSVQDIVEQMYEAFEEQAAGVDDYTLVHDMMGTRVTMYYEKEVVDGYPMFRLRQSSGSMMGLTGYGFVDDEVGQGDIHLLGPDLIEHGRYDGRETIEGNEVHVLAVDDISQLDVTAPQGPDDMDFEPKRARLYIDADQWVMRRMEMIGEAATGDGPQEITMRMDMRDYREVDGFLIAFELTTSIEGLEAMIDPEMQAQLEEMEEQLASLPEAQRAMMERMMGDQMERLREMMGGGGGPMTMTMTVTEAMVNQGPPR